MEKKELSLKKTIVGLVLIAGCFVAPYIRNICSLKAFEITGYTMGTSYTVKLVEKEFDGENLAALEKKIEAVLYDVSQQMSTYIPSSEISQFNNSKSIEPFEISADFAKVMLLSQKISRETQGAFDPTVSPLINAWGFGPGWKEDLIPSDNTIKDALNKIGYTKLTCTSTSIKKSTPELGINLGAIAKGFGVDKIAETVRAFGYDNYMVEIGGEVVTSGLNHKGVVWRIGVQKPVFGAEIGADNVMVVNLPSKAIATSGDYRNYFKSNGKTYSHVIDPRTGYPATTNVASASVVANSCILADALATALMVVGHEEGLALIEKYPDAEAFIAVRSGDNLFKTYKSSGFDQFTTQ